MAALGVRANADTPEDAQRAHRYGAQGIGLCRTEHMFMAPDRQPLMRAMIMAGDDQGRRAALDQLLPLQQRDFEGFFAEMTGLVVTIRLLDPPLHEFLPDRFELHEEVVLARMQQSPRLAELEQQLELIRSLDETNPMLGTRGVRLGILHPEICEMQVRGIVRAALAVRERSGKAPKVEVMIPLVGYDRELELARARVLETAEEEGFAYGSDFGVGTMIELPRACFIADRVARHADFFSFGTNDLTQTAIGFSRDDVEGRIIPRYVDERILDISPFASIDEPGVGELVQTAARLGRQGSACLELGVCGAHGGDPASIRVFHRAGMDYVSCSPFRLPIARVAAAQAAIASPRITRTAAGEPI